MSSQRPALAIHGAGRMGRLVWEAAKASDFNVVEVVSRAQPDWLPENIWFPSLGASRQQIDLIIDFSLPDGLGAVAAWVAEHRTPLVSGTTGLDDEHNRVLSRAAESAPVLWSANFSIGLNICLQMVSAMARVVPEQTDVTITDTHHVNKLDAPSGTALVLADALAPFKADIQSLREGDIIGTHEVRFDLAGESVSLTHQANERIIFAQGAVKAGSWLLNQPPGLYSMKEFLYG